MDKLRVGLILPAETVPAWAARLIERLQSQPETELVTALILPQPNSASGLFRAYFNFDRRVFRPKPSPWDGTSLPADLPCLHGDSSAQLQSLRLDVLLNLCLDEDPQDLLSLARFGVWSVHGVQVNAQPGWREVWEGNPLSVCEVEAARAGQLPQIVARSVLVTDQQSVSRNQMHLLWRAAILLPRALRQLALRGAVDFFSATQPALVAARASVPNPLQILAMGFKQALRWLRAKLPKLYSIDQWMLMLAPRGSDSPLTWDGFTPLQPPRDRFWADPFLVERDGRRYIFMEELPFSLKRGILVCITLDEHNRIESKTTILERPYHLSYPFVFEHNGQWYMIPETGGNRTIEVYRCEHFPDQWVFEKILMSGFRAVDSTLIEHDGRWWLFANLADDENNATWDSLHLFYADSPLSENWTPHPLNPIVSDVRTARPAGRIFQRGGQLIRPAQDSSRRYGGALHLQRIDKLSTTEYSETCVETLDAQQKGYLATHTINFLDNLTVIDVQARRSKFFG